VRTFFERVKVQTKPTPEQDYYSSYFGGKRSDDSNDDDEGDEDEPTDT